MSAEVGWFDVLLYTCATTGAAMSGFSLAAILIALFTRRR